MFDIYTNVHFNSHVSDQLHVADSLCFEVTSINWLQLLQALTDFTEIRFFLFAVRCYVVDAKFC